MNRNHLTLYILFALILSACSTIHVSKVPANRLSTGKDGLIYILPKIEYDVLVTVKKTELRAGEYFVKSKEDELYTQLDGMINLVTDRDQTTYTIEKLELVPRILPDENHIYHIETLGRNSLVTSKNFFFELTPHGYMKSGDVATTDYSAELVNTAAKTTAMIMGNYTAPLFASTKTYIPQVKKPTKSGIMDHIIREINRIRIAKREILIDRNTSYASAEISKLIQELEKEEARLLPLIAGTKSESTESRIFHYAPQMGKNPLFFFSKSQGITEEGDLENLVEIELSSSIRYSKRSRFGDSNHSGNQGLYYRIPATVNLRIQSKDRIYLNKSEVIPQLGTTANLPARIGLFKNKVNYKLDTKTGALILFEGNSEHMNPEEIKQIGNEVNQMLDQEQKEIEQLEREIKRIELQQKRDSLQEYL